MMTLRRPVALCLGLFAIAAPMAGASAQPYRALPVDEAGVDPELEAMRDQLLAAVLSRDTDAVLALASPDIALSFGGDYGRDTLRQWLGGVEGMPWTGGLYWQELAKALELGGAWYHHDDGRSHFCAPYTFYADYPDEIDPFYVIMVIRPDAALRSGPGLEQPIVARLDYDIAEIIDNGPGYDPDNPTAPYWLGIRTADGEHEGYMLSSDFRSPLDHRACFSQDPDTGRWVWDAFIAGD